MKTIRFAKTNTFVNIKIVDGKEVKFLYELAMYTVKKDYYSSVVHKGNVVRDFVVIDAYGLEIVEISESGDSVIKGEPIDLGVKTSHPRHINALIHALCRAPITDVQSVRTRYEEEASSQEWCNGWIDALAHTASVQLSRQLSSTELVPFTEKIRDKRNRFMRKVNVFRDLPIPAGRGLDA
jgi:hypothetical protein